MPGADSPVERWTTRILAYLGGAAAAVKVLEWLRTRPSLVGRIEKVIVWPEIEPGPDNLHPALVLRAYLSNRRPFPAAVESWSLVVWHRNARYTGNLRPLPEAAWFERQGETEPIVALDQVALKNPVEYGRITRGWLAFDVPVLLHGAMLRGSSLELIATDALGGRHRLRHRCE